MCFFSTDLWDTLQYPFNRDVTPDHLCDIQDGLKYTELAKPGRFLSFPEHTGLILNTDGVAVFNSSKHSLWLVYLSVTSLPPHLLMWKDHLLLAGIWYGPVKPKMDTILNPVLEYRTPKLFRINSKNI